MGICQRLDVVLYKIVWFLKVSTELRKTRVNTRSVCFMLYSKILFWQDQSPILMDLDHPYSTVFILINAPL